MEKKLLLHACGCIFFFLCSVQSDQPTRRVKISQSALLLDQELKVPNLDVKGNRSSGVLMKQLQEVFKLNKLYLKH